MVSSTVPQTTRENNSSYTTNPDILPQLPQQKHTTNQETNHQTPPVGSKSGIWNNPPTQYLPAQPSPIKIQQGIKGNKKTARMDNPTDTGHKGIVDANVWIGC